jgi:DNA-binding HxlR family transcriptional regulator
MLVQQHSPEWVKENVKLCPINNSMQLIGKKFAILILRNMIVFRQTRFSQFMDTIDGMNSKTLTARLRELERSGLISRKVYPEVPPRVEYCLTQKGRSLKPVLEGLAAFSIQNYHDRIFHEGIIHNSSSDDKEGVDHQKN